MAIGESAFDTGVQKPPSSIEPDTDWKHYDLYQQVREVLFSVPSQFDTNIFIEGLLADDIFSLNTTLATAIERNVVDTLNNMRDTWDNDSEYSDCRFIRQSQTFPDVLLVRQTSSSEREVIMGIELKGWYLLSKEMEPSFRYCVTQDACSPQDLIAIFPWCLSEVISGDPNVLEPFVDSALRASKYVDYYWKNRNAANTKINKPSNVQTYPSKTDRINDKPAKGTGANYGRLARTGIMDAYVNQNMMEKKISGIPIREWNRFMHNYSESENTIVSANSNPKSIADGGAENPLEYEGAVEEEAFTEKEEPETFEDTSGPGPRSPDPDWDGEDNLFS